MYGHAAAYGERAYGETVGAAVVLFLDDLEAERCWLLEIDAFSLAPAPVGDPAGSFAEGSFAEIAFSEGEETASSLSTFYYSDRGYISHVSDNPSATWYDGRLLADLGVERRIYSRRGIGGLTRVSGSFKLVNTGGELDYLVSAFSLPGRALRAHVGRPDDPKVNFIQVVSGVVDGTPTFTAGYVEIRFSDGSARLSRLLNENTYAGTGSLEGGADLKGRYKPRCYGKAPNVSPPLVDSVKLIYQVNDGALNDVPSVYDRGIALARGADYASQAELEATPPAAAQYRVWKAGGFFRLGSTPAGTVTADAEGDATPTYIQTTADIVKRLLEVQLSLSASEIDASAFSALNTAAPAPVHLWCGVDGRMLDDAIDELLAGIGAFGGFSRLGTFTVGIIALPSGVTAAAYTEEQIGEIERLQLPPSVDPIVWRVLVGYDRNHTIQADLAAGVADARRSYAAQPMRLEKSDDATIKSRHLLARELLVAGLYRDQADAATEAARLKTLWGNPRALLKVPLPLAALPRELNEVISLTHQRHGLAAGVDVRVLAHAISTAGVELEVLA